MVDKSLLKLTLIILTGIIQGCSYLGVGQKDFSCPGGIEGVRCMSARQVYQATESSDYVKTKTETTDSDDDKSKDVKPTDTGFGNGQPLTSQVAVPRIDQPIPIRTQAKVMRIWMSSWEDEDGDLHADGFLYTEIEDRRWNLGGRFKSPGTALSPLTISTPTPLPKK